MKNACMIGKAPDCPPSVTNLLILSDQMPPEPRSRPRDVAPWELELAELSHSENMHKYQQNDINTRVSEILLVPYLICRNSQERGLHGYMIHGALGWSHRCLQTRFQTFLMEHMSTRA